MKYWRGLFALALGTFVAERVRGEGPVEKPVAEWIAELGNERSESARIQAAKHLAVQGKSVVPQLIEAAADAKLHRRIAAMWALRDIGPDAEAAIPVLIERLNEKGTTFAAADALGAIGERAADAAPELLKHTHRDRTFSGPHIQMALAKLGPKAATHVRAALDKPLPGDTEERSRRISSLVGLLVGYGEEYALPLFKHEHPQVRALVCGLMSGKKNALPHVIGALDDSAGEVRMSAASSLRAFDGGPLTAFGKLVAQLKDDYVEARVTACWAIREIGPAAEGCRDALIHAAAQDPRVRLPAGLALDGIGHEQAAIAEYRRALQVESQIDRYSAAIRLGAHGPRAESAIPELIRALDDEHPNVRRYAAEALGKIGRSANQAILKLESMSADAANYQLRAELDEAIKRLRQKQ